MTYVVTDDCIQCKFTDCVAVCPVDCFYEGPNFLAIQPDECIDCDACVDVCPVNAICSENDLPESKSEFLLLNEVLSHNWPQITEQKDPLPEAEHWQSIKNKLDHLVKDWPEV